MSGKRWVTSRDANELEIVKKLRAHPQVTGVYRIESTLDPGVLDLLVCVEDSEMARWRDVLMDGKAIRGVALLNDAVARVRSRLHRYVVLEVKVYERKTHVPKGVDLADVQPGGRYEGLGLLYGERLARQLKITQAEFLINAKGPVGIASSYEEALAALGLEVES